MPTREAYLHVFVVDSSGKPLPPPAGAITLRPAAGGAAIAPDKPWSEAEGVTYKLSSQDLELVIAYPMRTELHQFFTAVAPAEQPKLTAYWPGTDKDPSASGKRPEYLLECSTLQRVAGGSSADRSPSVYHLTVALAFMRELVSVIGSDYWEGGSSPHRAHLDFVAYSNTYAQHLSASGFLNPCSPYTVFNCDLGTQETWMRTKVNGWRRQKVVKIKTAVPAWTTFADFTDWLGKLDAAAAAKYIGALDIYGYLSAAGTKRPGTVADFSIFSHAWAGGPILYNTNGSGPGDPRRAPADLDMRTIDFNGTNSPAWAAMPRAFTSDANLHNWGCFATTVYRDIINYLGRTKATSTEPFPWPDGTKYTRADTIAIIQNAIEGSYMKALARFTNRPVYGGPPGYGAENIDYPALPDIPANLRTKVKGKILHIPAIVGYGYPAKVSTARRMYDGGSFGSPNWNYFGYMRYPP